jgi:hypothetical protein
MFRHDWSIGMSDPECAVLVRYYMPKTNKEKGRAFRLNKTTIRKKQTSRIECSSIKVKTT